MFVAPTPELSAARVPAPNGSAGVAFTLSAMRAMVEQAKGDPAIIQAATSIVYLMPEHSEHAEALALFNFVRDSVRYVRDPVGLESLAYPATTLKRMVGDCDDQTTLLASLLESIGYPTRFVVAGYASRDFEHVYLQVMVGGQWVSCDPTERHFFGWEPPDPLVIRYESR